MDTDLEFQEPRWFVAAGKPSWWQTAWTHLQISLHQVTSAQFELGMRRSRRDSCCWGIFRISLTLLIRASFFALFDFPILQYPVRLAWTVLVHFCATGFLVHLTIFVRMFGNCRLINVVCCIQCRVVDSVNWAGVTESSILLGWKTPFEIYKCRLINSS